MGCILFSGAYFTPKAGMVGFLLQYYCLIARAAKGSSFTRHAVNPSMGAPPRHPWRGGSLKLLPLSAGSLFVKAAKGSSFADTP